MRGIVVVRHAWFAVALFAACSNELGAPQGDGGSSPLHDAGTADAADAGSNTPDAGSNMPDAESRPSDTCIVAGTCAPGTWVDVTPPNAMPNDLTPSCGNYGTLSVGVDPKKPANIYTEFNCKGVWKSTDYGSTWTGPINTGINGKDVSDCAGGITVANGDPGKPPILYEACIRGSGTGFWVSTNDVVDWTRYKVDPGGSRQDFYPPTVDPYDSKHLLMAGHEQNIVVQSTNGGQTWTSISLDPAMNTTGGTDAFAFINTGNAATTAQTWLFLPQATGGIVGMWRTEDAGANWKRVDSNEKEHSYYQVYQPGTKGEIYAAGIYSSLGYGVLRSTDYGVKWEHVGLGRNENIVFGTSKHLYAMDGTSSNLEVGDPAVPSATWTSPMEAAGMCGATAPGPSIICGTVQAAVTNDGTYNIVFAANWNNGLWRYVEP